MKVLLSAYACEPEKGSEPGVGWNWVREISKIAKEVWVITRSNNKKAIEDALEKEPMPNVHWVYFDLPKWARFWKKGQRGVHLYYYLWQICIYFVARRLHKEVRFDIVHHITFGNHWMPSFLSLLHTKFIIGPVGGGESAPKSFYRTFSIRGRLYEYIRSLIRIVGELDPFTKLTIKRASVVLVKAQETKDRVIKLGAKSVFIISEVILSEDEIKLFSSMPLPQGDPIRFLSLGRLIHWKGFHLGLMAFARFVKEFPESEYWMVGEGPERKSLEKLAEELGVADKVRFWGFLPRKEALKKLAECHVLVHPSLHDSGGWVCVEAMAAGRPVICLDIGGPAVQATEDTGFKIPAITPDQVVNHIAEAMKKLAIDNNLLIYMSEKAKERAMNEFSWGKRRNQILNIYSRILNI